MEYLVSAHYLADKPEDIDRIPKMSTKVKKRLTMRDRFEHVIPGYYESGYGFSSEFTHPGHASHVLKMLPDDSGTYKADMGIKFNSEWFSLCLNELTMLLAGFLKTYFIKYKDSLRYKNASDRDCIGCAIAELLKVLYSHIELKGKENEWHKATRPLWDW